MRYSFNQCEMTSAAHPRPTSVLSFSPLRDPLLRKGWPKLADQGRRYIGPLEPQCRCGRSHEPWNNQRRTHHTDMEPGVVTRLMSIAEASGLARHLRTGRSTARHPAKSTRTPSSPSPSSRSSSRGSTATCIPSPASLMDDQSFAQWDDDAAAALGIPTRNQDCAWNNSSEVIKGTKLCGHAGLLELCGTGHLTFRAVCILDDLRSSPMRCLRTKVCHYALLTA